MTERTILLAAALATAGYGSAQAGSLLDPMDIAQCWNVGALSSAARATTVSVAFSLGRDGRVVAGSVRLIAPKRPTPAAEQAYAAARRAILRCGIEGYNLPPDRYDDWKDIEVTFNPTEMVIS